MATRKLERVHRENAGTPGARLGELHARLKQAMFAHAGLVRDAESMERGIEAIAVLRVELDALAPVAAHALGHFYEVRNMLDVAEAVTRSAMHREESRGAHFRIDYPEKNDARWLVATRVFGSAGSLQLDERDLSANAALAAAAAR